MSTPDPVVPGSILRAALTAFATGLIGGFIATAVIIGPLHLWAADAATVELDPATATGETGVEVDGCRLHCSFQPAHQGQPAHIVVRGDNPGGEARTHAIHVMVVADEPVDRMSRIGRLPRMLSTVAGTLALNARKEGAATIDLTATFPAGARILVDIGKVGMAIRTAIPFRSLKPGAMPSTPAPSATAAAPRPPGAISDPVAMLGSR